MIISASYKTDIPAFYADWFMARLRAGWCRMTNPWGGQTYDIPLTADAVDGFVFWTRNMRPLVDRLETVATIAPFTVQYTITGYPRALETSTLPPDRAVADLRQLARRFGPRIAVWRYDPILFTSVTPAGWHRETFTHLARSLAGAVDEVVISFAQIYRKTRRNLDAAAVGAFDWHDPDAVEKRTLAAALTDIAASQGMSLRLCAQADYMPGEGAGLARCIDAARLSDVAGRVIAAPVKGNRPDCLCHQARDIGAYDTCPHGCVYCYAVNAPERAKRRYAAHDPAGPFLFPPA